MLLSLENRHLWILVTLALHHGYHGQKPLGEHRDVVVLVLRVAEHQMAFEHVSDRIVAGLWIPCRQMVKVVTTGVKLRTEVTAPKH